MTDSYSKILIVSLVVILAVISSCCLLPVHFVFSSYLLILFQNWFSTYGVFLQVALLFKAIMLLQLLFMQSSFLFRGKIDCITPILSLKGGRDDVSVIFPHLDPVYRRDIKLIMMIIYLNFSYIKIILFSSVYSLSFDNNRSIFVCIFVKLISFVN